MGSKTIERLRSGELDIIEHTHKCIEEAKRLNEEFSHFTRISEEDALRSAKELKKNIEESKNKPLFGYMISAKDAICIKGVESRGGSAILNGYHPLFDATVIRKVREQGGIIIGKTSQDEFGFGSFSVNVGNGFEIPKNPHDKERSCGGSSGGAAGFASAATFPHIALGESTGGSIASPASFCGVFGLTPTYGRNSRYGLIDYGNSLDKIGPIAKTLKESALLQEVIAGFDPLDSTSLEIPSKPLLRKEETQEDLKGMKIAIIKEGFVGEVDERISNKVRRAAASLADEGALVDEISLEFPLKYSLAAYYVLATSEASTNLSKYCGMRYGKSDKLEGNFNSYFSKVRSSAFGEEAKRRIILGTFARMSGQRDAFYIKAAKVRTLIIQSYKEAFKKYDALITPTTPILPPKFEEIKKLTPLQHYMMDILLVGPNLAGLPHLSVPIGMEEKLPIGMLLIGDHLEERKLVRIASPFEVSNV